MYENKDHEKFADLAEKRVTRAIKDLRLIGNLANRSNYYYEEQDVKKIIGTLQTELRMLKKRFEKPGRNNDAASQRTVTRWRLELRCAAEQAFLVQYHHLRPGRPA